MLGSLRGTAAAIAAVSILVGTSVATAAPVARAPAPSSIASAPTVDPWLTLSAMTGSSSDAAAVLAAKQDDDDDDVAAGWPPLASLTVILGTIGTAIYILLDDDDSNNGDPIPLSPA